MTISQQADAIVERYANLIRESDFHIPEFISNVKCADGSKEYAEVLEFETIHTATLCGIKEAEARIEECMKMGDIIQEYGTFKECTTVLCRYVELTAIHNELKSRL